MAGVGPGVGLPPWLFVAKLSCMILLEADIATSLLPTCGCGSGPGDVNCTTFGHRSIICVWAKWWDIVSHVHSVTCSFQELSLQWHGFVPVSSTGGDHGFCETVKQNQTPHLSLSPLPVHFPSPFLPLSWQTSPLCPPYSWFIPTCTAIARSAFSIPWLSHLISVTSSVNRRELIPFMFFASKLFLSRTPLICHSIACCRVLASWPGEPWAEPSCIL